MSPTDPAPERAFTLIEILAVCAIAGILLAVVVPAVGLQMLQSRVAAENTTLQNLAAAVQESFESTDLEGTNIAAIAGSLPAGVDATAFSASTNPTVLPGTTNTFDWFAKIARQMGDSPAVGVAPTPALQPQVATLLVNAAGNARIMLMGPSTEPTQQRFLLVSLMEPGGGLAIPSLPDPSNPQDPADLALFNDIWNTNWSNPAAVLPPTWTAALTAQQAQAWQGSGGSGGRLWLLCVQRIVCPIYTLTINNTHPTDNCYVCYNINGTTAGASVTAAANSGASVVTGIYYGRQIQAYRGTAPPPAAQLFSQFILRDTSEITLQD